MTKVTAILTIIAMKAIATLDRDRIGDHGEDHDEEHSDALTSVRMVTMKTVAMQTIAMRTMKREDKPVAILTAVGETMAKRARSSRHG